MPTIKSTDRMTTELYKSFQTEAAKLGENNDCTVRAVAAVTGVSYATAHEAMARAGRKNRQGAHISQQHRALRELGFTVIEHRASTVIQTRYPNGGKGYSSITTHHPARLQQVWKDGKRYMFHTRGHVLAVIDGQNHDWTVGMSKRVVWIFEVVKAPIALTQLP